VSDNKTMSKATPRPWQAYKVDAPSYITYIKDANGLIVVGALNHIECAFQDEPCEVDFNNSELNLHGKLKSTQSVYGPTPEGKKQQEIQDANAELIVKAVNMHDELVEFIENLENDDGSIPAKIWEWRNSILQKAKAAK
jgi:hypothetical protein